MVVANAGNALADETRLKALGSGLDATVEPLDRVFLAIQGPAAAAALEAAGVDVSGLFFMRAASRGPAGS